MSEEDLPARLLKYDGDHVQLERIALLRDQVVGLPSFPASDKRNDPRYQWFTGSFGHECWELDAMDPRDLRAVVEAAIVAEIEMESWQRCERINRAEQASLRDIITKWRGEESNDEDDEED
jgi:hypothetical protein